MTIVRVWGEINGVGMIPAFAVGDQFYFSPPPTLTGRYVCQFWAEDDYGNTAYEVALLTIFEGMVKCIELLTREWGLAMLGDTMAADMCADTYSSSMDLLHDLQAIPDEWSVVAVPAVCSRDMVEALI